MPVFYNYRDPNSPFQGSNTWFSYYGSGKNGGGPLSMLAAGVLLILLMIFIKKFLL